MIANGMLLGVCVAVMIAIVGAFATGGLTTPYAIFALAIGSLFPLRGIYLSWRENRLRPTGAPLGVWDWLAVFAFTLFALRSFLWVVYTSGDAVKVLNINNLGDLPLHWQYVQFLAHGAAFWPDNPITAHGGIGYPFGVDLLNALTVLAGLDTLRSFVWVGLFGAALTGIMLFRWGRAFVLAGFLFNGGMSVIVELWEWTLNSVFHVFNVAQRYEGIADLLESTLNPGQTVDWKSIPLALFVTQRGFLYAFPVGLLLLDSWRSRIETIQGEKPVRPPLATWAEILLYATMPIFHLHTFLFLSVALAWWFVLGGEKVREHALKVVAFALIPATALVLLLTDFFSQTGGAFQLKPGWMQGDAPFFPYWFSNFGIALPLAILLVAVVFVPRLPGLPRIPWPTLRTGERAVAQLFVGPAALVFLACCLFAFSYWEWDNTKLMAWAYLVWLPFLWNVLLRRWTLWVRIPVVVALFFSGFLTMLGGLTPPDNGYQISTRSEIDAVAMAIEPLPIESRIASAADYNHPLVFLGRKMAMGYPGHFTGHGLPLELVQQDMTTLMLGTGDWRAAAERLEADYIFWGTRERAAYPASTRPWVSDSVLVASGPWGELYRLPGADSPQPDHEESVSATRPE